MSEVALVPFDSKIKTHFTVENNTFFGQGEVICPFSMLNITDQSYLSDLKNQGYNIFASIMPLSGGLYWLMFIKTDQELELRYYQSQPLIENEEFEIFFRTCKKPLILGNMNMSKQLPKMTFTQALRLGTIEGVDIVTHLNMYGIDYITLDRTLTIDEIEKIIVTKNEYCKGVPFNVLYPDE